jgi:hypothetical protein
VRDVRFAVDQGLRASTSQPSANSRSYKCDPRNPHRPSPPPLPPRLPKIVSLACSGAFANLILPFAPLARRGLDAVTTFHFGVYFLIEMIFIPFCSNRGLQAASSFRPSGAFSAPARLLNPGRWLTRKIPAKPPHRRPQRPLPVRAEAARLYNQVRRKSGSRIPSNPAPRSRFPSPTPARNSTIACCCSIRAFRIAPSTSLRRPS